MLINIFDLNKKSKKKSLFLPALHQAHALSKIKILVIKIFWGTGSSPPPPPDNEG